MRVRVPAIAKETEVSSSSDPFALGPASQLLQQIRSEHLYSTSSNCSLDKYCDPEECPASSKDDSDNDISSLLDKLKTKTATKDAKSTNPEIELDMLSLNADSIQRQFQNMIDMTSFSQIPDLERCSPSTSRVRKVTFVENVPEPVDSKKDGTKTNCAETSKAKTDTKKTESTLAKDKTEHKSNSSRVEKEKISKSSKTSDKSKIKRSKARKILVEPRGKSMTAESERNSQQANKDCKAVNQDDWRTFNKVMEAERTMNLYLKYTAELLVKRWGEYLAMTTDQIRQFEIENAKELGMIDEVIEMLEDKDRYVWQLIDELRFW